MAAAGDCGIGGTLHGDTAGRHCAVLPFLWHLRERSDGWGQFAMRATWLLPLACWGLLAYMAMQYARFGDPLIFASTQDYWRVRPAVPPGVRTLALATWEPIWSAYLPS